MCVCLSVIVGEMDTYDVCCFTAVQDHTELIRVVLLEFDFVLDLEFSNAYLCVQVLVFECPRECWCLSDGV